MSESAPGLRIEHRNITFILLFKFKVVCFVITTAFTYGICTITLEDITDTVLVFFS